MKTDPPEAFDVFWTAYPRRVGKGAARKAFAKAIKLTDLRTMLEAIDRYVAHKPDWQHYCHPATWLNGERWDDEWTTPERPKTRTEMMREKWAKQATSH